MKGKYKYLLRMQLYNLFGINRLIHSRDKREKQRSAIVAALGLVAIAILAIYITKFSNSMAEAGLGKALPTLMVVVCSLTTLTLTFVKSTGVLIGLKDYDMVMSMPVNTISIVTSRVTLLYLINLIIGFISMLPSSIIYIVYEHPPICSYLFLLLVVASFAVFFMPSTLRQQVEVMEIMIVIQNIMPIALAIFVSMTSTTAASLSLEGKNRWIMCSVPTQARTVYNSKIAVNLTVILPVLYVSAILIRIVIPCSLMQTVLMFLIPTVYAFFISVLGIYLNIKFPKYDWTSEYYAVKGGAISVLATVGGGMASSLTPLYLCIIFPHYQMIIMLGITCLILLATLVIYHKVCQMQLYV